MTKISIVQMPSVENNKAVTHNWLIIEDKSNKVQLQLNDDCDPRDCYNSLIRMFSDGEKSISAEFTKDPAIMDAPDCA